MTLSGVPSEGGAADARLIAQGWKVVRVFTLHERCCRINPSTGRPDWKCGAPDKGIVGYEYARESE